MVSMKEKLVESLGLPAGSGEAAILDAVGDRLAKAEVREAIKDRKILASHADSWLTAFKSDFKAAKAALAALCPGRAVALAAASRSPAPAGSDLDRVHGRVTAQLGVKPMPTPRTVAASASPIADARERAILDDLGLPIAQVPDPVRLVEGKDPATWTQQERDDAALWALGPAFRAGLKPPPGTARIYQPSPNDHMEFVDGQWRAKSDYQGRA
jgi:hypothetical protein